MTSPPSNIKEEDLTRQALGLLRSSKGSKAHTSSPLSPTQASGISTLMDRMSVGQSLGRVMAHLCHLVQQERSLPTITTCQRRTLTVWILATPWSDGSMRSTSSDGPLRSFDLDHRSNFHALAKETSSRAAQTSQSNILRMDQRRHPSLSALHEGIACGDAIAAYRDAKGIAGKDCQFGHRDTGCLRGSLPRRR